MANTIPWPAYAEALDAELREDNVWIRRGWHCWDRAKMAHPEKRRKIVAEYVRAIRDGKTWP
jgi:hypothetical protein